MMRYLRLPVLLVISWCVMTTTHEVGHLFGGWLTGGTLRDVELRPWHLPHSRFSPDPVPLVTLWSGPMIGVIVPLMVAVAVKKRWTWFVADFCLLANGLYLALAWLSGDHWLDTQRLLDAGASRWSIALFCLVTIGAGYRQFRKAIVTEVTELRRTEIDYSSES